MQADTPLSTKQEEGKGGGDTPICPNKCSVLSDQPCRVSQQQALPSTKPQLCRFHLLFNALPGLNHAHFIEHNCVDPLTHEFVDDFCSVAIMYSLKNNARTS